MDDFSTPGHINTFGLTPSEANFIKAFKRPLSSQSPIIIVDRNNNVRLVIGASGGSRILSGVAQAAIKVLWMGHNLKQAIDAKRVHHQLEPNHVELEKGFNEVNIYFSTIYFEECFINYFFL
jgi:gamma-glutamyltranspeptidase/glutathione hydrolase/leukotriene-C4 hydrolase